MTTITARHERETRLLPRAKLLIGGEDVFDASGGGIDHVNPTTGRKQAEVVLGGTAEVDRAVDAAIRASVPWRRATGGTRRDLLLKLLALILAEGETLATVGALEMGGTRRMFIDGLLPFIRDWFSVYAGWADKIDGGYVGDFGTGPFDVVVPEPYGVVALVIPWNGPLSSLAMKAAPALAAGNTLVIKPPETAPFSAIRFGELARQAGFPDGVVNILVGGPELGDRLVRHPGVDKISFTGSPATARRIIAATAETITPTVFELGGKSANIIFPDADIGATVALAGSYPFVNAGQICVNPSRLIVHRDVYDEVLARVADLARAVTVGDPLDDATAMGPMFTRAGRDHVLETVARAAERPDVEIVAGGGIGDPAPADGWFIQPTVIADADPTSEIAQTELFGPVVTVHRFATEDEAIAIANGTEYGLSAYLNTSSIDRALRMARQLRAGGVYINRALPVMNPNLPFGGVGASGYGREGGRAGLDEFMRSKAISIGLGA